MNFLKNNWHYFFNAVLVIAVIWSGYKIDKLQDQVALHEQHIISINGWSNWSGIINGHAATQMKLGIHLKRDGDGFVVKPNTDFGDSTLITAPLADYAKFGKFVQRYSMIPKE